MADLLRFPSSKGPDADQVRADLAKDADWQDIFIVGHDKEGVVRTLCSDMSVADAVLLLEQAKLLMLED